MNKIIEKTKTKKYYTGNLKTEEIPIFIITDNNEFENKIDAEKHQNYLDEKEKDYKVFTVVIINDKEDFVKDYYIIKSKEELIKLENYIIKYNNKYLSQFSFMNYLKEFPVALHYYIDSMGDYKPRVEWEILTFDDISNIYKAML